MSTKHMREDSQEDVRGIYEQPLDSLFVTALYVLDMLPSIAKIVAMFFHPIRLKNTMHISSQQTGLPKKKPCRSKKAHSSKNAELLHNFIDPSKWRTVK